MNWEKWGRHPLTGQMPPMTSPSGEAGEDAGRGRRPETYMAVFEFPPEFVKESDWRLKIQDSKFKKSKPLWQET
jgi:hypothetical protein